LDNKTVVVSGGAGFIGSHFIDEIFENSSPKKVVAIDNFYLGNQANLIKALKRPNFELIRCDATDFNTMSYITRKLKVDYFFNFAVLPLPTSLEYPAWSSKINFDLALTSLELARLGYVKKLIQISSSEVYGSAKKIPMSEDHPLNAETPYAASKAAADQLALSYQRSFGLNILILRPFNNYGPRQNRFSYAGVIPIFINQTLNGSDCIIYGDGKQTRDFTFVGDTVNVIFKISQINEAWGKGPINIASETETSINEIYSMISKLSSNTIREPIFVESRSGDVKRHCGDASLLKKFLPEVLKIPTINITGLKQTFDWYRNNAFLPK